MLLCFLKSSKKFIYLPTRIQFVCNHPKNFTNKFLSKYKKLKVSDKQNDFDARIQGLIHFPGKTDTICMNGIKEIIINDIYMQATEDFSTLVNNEILKNYTIHKKKHR